jgi:hypothetical protein
MKREDLKIDSVYKNNNGSVKCRLIGFDDDNDPILMPIGNVDRYLYDENDVKEDSSLVIGSFGHSMSTFLDYFEEVKDDSVS